MKKLTPFVLFLANVLVSAQASEPVVFVSSFSPGDKGAIHAFRFDSKNGQLAALHRTTDLENPFFLAISTDGLYLYAIDAKQFGGTENEFVVSYAVHEQNRKLTRLNRQSASGAASCYLDVDTTGKTVVVANYSTGNLASLPVRDDGSLGKAVTSVQHSGSSVDPKSQTAPHVHSIAISPDNRFVMAADLGVDKILIYRLNSSTAELAPSDAQAFADLPPGSGPRHLTFHPNGKRLYVINELSNTVVFFEYVSKTGTLIQRQTISTLPVGFTGTSHTADLKITPDGKFLYGTNRGHDSIAIFRIANDGHLGLVGIEPSQGRGPQNLLISSDGRWLLCANMPGNNVVVFAIDAATGSLMATASPVSVPMPSCIRWLESP